MHSSVTSSVQNNVQIVVANVVTWNSSQTIVPCIQALLSQHGFTLGKDLFVSVTDNNSSDDTVEKVTSSFGELVNVTANAQNTGFSGGHNSGITRALQRGASFYAAINPDVVLEPTVLSCLRETLNRDARCGAIAPKLLRADESLKPVVPARFDSTGMYITPSVRHFDRGSEEIDDGQYERAQYIFGVSGAVAMFSRRFILDVSIPSAIGNEQTSEFFDDTFFAYREDAELAWRGQRLGWKFRYEPAVKALHVRRVLPERRSTLPAEINALGVKNRFLLQWNHLTPTFPILYSPALWIRNLSVIGAVLLKERTSYPALRSAFQLRPWGKRRNKLLSKRERVSSLAMLHWFRNHPVAYPALTTRLPTEPVTRVTVIVVNYNSGSRLSSCLRSLNTLVSPDSAIKCEIVVVDNASSDNSHSRLEPVLRELPGFHLIKSETNLGFAGAINLAARRFPAHAYLLLNPDIELLRVDFESLASTLNRYGDLAAVAPILFNKDDTVQKEFIARSFPSLGSTLAELFFVHRLWPNNPWTTRYLRRKDRFLLRYANQNRAPLSAPYESLDQPLIVDQPPAACLLIRHTDMVKVAGLDSGYWPAWFEDVDFCKKLSAQGRLSALVGTARAIHEGGYSKEQIGNSRFASIWYPNLLRYWRLHGTKAEFILLRCLLPLALLMRSFVAAVQSKQGDENNRQLQWQFARTLFMLAFKVGRARQPLPQS